VLKKILLIIVLIIGLGFSCADVIAQNVSKTGTTAGKFLSIGVGAKANAMGEAYTSIADDPSAIYWNPAGIARIDSYEALFSYSKLFADMNLSFLGVVIPGGSIGNFGVGVTSINYGSIGVTTENFPDGTGETFTPASYAFDLSYARNITDDFSVGASVKYIRETIYNSDASGVAFDVGTIFNTPFYGIKFSSSISNYGSKMQMGGSDLLIRYNVDPTRAGSNQTVDAYIATDQFDLPLRLQIGISREFQILESQKLTLAADALVPNDNYQSVNLGGELSFFDDMIALRGGYKTLFLKDSQEGLTLGFGLKYKRAGFIDFAFDYAYQKFTYLGNIQTFDIVLKF
jgi:Type IX secretion system protein PorV